MNYIHFLFPTKLSIFLTYALMVLNAQCDQRVSFDIRNYFSRLISTPAIVGGLKVVSQTREVPHFYAIDVKNVPQVKIIQGKKKIIVTADDNVIDRISTRVSPNQTLWVELQEGNYKDIVAAVEIHTPFARTVRASGPSTTVVLENYKAPRATIEALDGATVGIKNGSFKTLLIKASGASKIFASGKAERQRIILNDHSHYSADALINRTARLQKDSTSSASIYRPIHSPKTL